MADVRNLNVHAPQLSLQEKLEKKASLERQYLSNKEKMEERKKVVSIVKGGTLSEQRKKEIKHLEDSNKKIEAVLLRINKEIEEALLAGIQTNVNLSVLYAAQLGDDDQSDHAKAMRQANQDLQKEFKKLFPKDPSYFGHNVHIGKKGVDFGEDAWAIFKGPVAKKTSHATAEMVSVFAMSTLGLIVTFIELSEAINMIQHARSGLDPLADQNKAAGAAIVALGCADIAFTATYMAPTVATEIGKTTVTASVASAAALMPILIAATFVAIYTVNLLRQQSKCNLAEKRQQEAKDSLIRFYKDNHTKINDAREKLARREALSTDEVGIIAQYNSLQHLYKKSQIEYEKEKALRNAAIAEVLGSTVVLVGTILGSAAVIGASIATIIPSLVIATGVLLAIAAKLYELKKEKDAEYKLAKEAIGDLENKSIAAGQLPFASMAHLVRWVGELKKEELTPENLKKALVCYEKIMGAAPQDRTPGFFNKITHAAYRRAAGEMLKCLDVNTPISSECLSALRSGDLAKILDKFKEKDFAKFEPAVSPRGILGRS